MNLKDRAEGDTEKGIHTQFQCKVTEAAPVAGIGEGAPRVLQHRLHDKNVLVSPLELEFTACKRTLEFVCYYQEKEFGAQFI